MSLVEVIVSIAILASLFGWMATVTRTSERAFEQRAASSDVELRSDLALSHIVRELEVAIAEEVEHDPLDPGRLGFARLESVVVTDLHPSEPRELRFEYGAGETDDGTDEDGDGLVDEGCVVLVTELGTANETRRVIARGIAELAEGEFPNGLDDNGNGLVDEPGFFVEFDGSVLGVSMTLQRDVRNSAYMVSRTVRTSILLRN